MAHSTVRRMIGYGSLLFGWSTICLHAEIRLPHILSDHAVLQRERPIHIWGWGDPGETIDIAFHQQKLTLVASDLGTFSGWLAPEKAGGPYVLSLTGRGGAHVDVGDLLVGDVWFASGQSNMEMPLKGFPGQAVVKNAGLRFRRRVDQISDCFGSSTRRATFLPKMRRPAGADASPGPQLTFRR